MRLLAIIVLIVVVAVIIATRAQRQEFQKVEEREVKTFVYGSGSISPKVRARIKAEVSGQVLEVLVEDGQVVKSGQLLARIDQSAIDSSLKEASIELKMTKQKASEDSEYVKSLKARVESTRKRTEFLQEVLKRREELYKDGLISKEALEKAKTDYEIAKKELESLESSLQDSIEDIKNRLSLSSARLERLKIEKNKHEIKSPVEGVILKKDISKGDVVQVGEVLFMIGQPIWEVVLEVDEEYASLVKVGQRVELRLNIEEGRVIEGFVSEILPKVDRSRKLLSIKVRAEIPPNIPFDASVDGKIEVKTERVFVIPKDYYKDGSVIVFDGVRKVKVPVLVKSEDSDKLLVKGQLKAGSKLIKP
ncbi:MAG: efflux RND transporter periplasmic adaptor subunit [Aquificaceae bacterium]|nr:efflux RND transporter periplasmic adaptor subunit [Aquificaceae bacterium]MDW8236822.1 efflux RND transporter periplasmic adaptor subunit [Aquificaceae bacterium]